jgi:hypothetical protein
MKKKTIRVQAGKGLTMPIHPGIAMDTTERFFTDSVPVVVIADDRFVRKCLRNGDLVEVKEAWPAAADDAKLKKGKE